MQKGKDKQFNRVVLEYGEYPWHDMLAQNLSSVEQGTF